MRSRSLSQKTTSPNTDVMGKSAHRPHPGGFKGHRLPTQNIVYQALGKKAPTVPILKASRVAAYLRTILYASSRQKSAHRPHRGGFRGRRLPTQGFVRVLKYVAAEQLRKSKGKGKYIKKNNDPRIPGRYQIYRDI
ncbi:hypothetical protein NDU88_006893 [Pleurodeles waltl]|uniref:50S ribosomal protein L34e n=1 Tax=Pleurodeles waltl TaxID=8319 RepID=A0AAV7MF82_PLEWA|nr:hypothetical protein NDU88_006893 [Pleurodeles waltl]